MPLTFEVDVSAQDASLIAAHLQQNHGFDAQITPYGLRLQCDRARKVEVLSALTSLGAVVTDIRMRMPSLEDVFFGLSE